MVHHRNYRSQPFKLTPQILLGAYMQGAFPMARSRNDPRIEWINPDPRAILPFDRMRVSRTLRQTIRQGVFDVRFDSAFERVIRACASPRPDHPDTWINEDIIQNYCKLHEMGHVHCVEAWRNDQLVGGLYGVAIGGAFCGESMFHKAELGGTNASKVCLYHLIEHLKARGFCLLDVQINSDHMRRIGAIDVSRSQYLRRLEEAIVRKVRW